MIELLVFSIVGALALHWILSRYAANLRLIDTPDERKAHWGRVPVVGGLSIFVISSLALIIFDIPMPIDANVLFLACVVFGFGLVDDQIGLTPLLRIIAQFIVAILSIAIGELHLYFFGDIFGIGDFYLGFWGELLTVLAIVTAINAYNMIDGIDGLLACLLIMVFVILMLIDPVFTLFYLLCISQLLVFLLYNLGVISSDKSVGKVFMGDSGSMLFGYLIVAILLAKSQHPNIEVRPVTVLWLIAVPLMDLVAIVIRRSRKGQPLMKADRDHLHHIFLRMGYSDRQALVIIVCIAVIFSCFGLLCEYLQFNEAMIFAIFLAVFGFYLYFILHAWRFVRLFNFLRRRKQYYADKSC